ncbi:MAG: threonine ammonia-lyase, biosynthetic [Pseudomonadota bacterium]
MTLPDYPALIDAADIYDVAVRTPLDPAPRLSERLANTVWLKREDQQPVFSFKLRGAWNLIASLDSTAVRNGVVCSSAGNHAQGVALAAARRELPAVIVMPVTTPAIKVEAVRKLGGDIVLHGDTYDEAERRARQLADEAGLYFVHPFNDPLVIAGQGTIGRELLQQAVDGIDYVFVPIGGGGLIAGIASYLKARRPDVTVIGVEPADSAGMRAALIAGKPVTLDHVGMFADGVAVKRVGDETFRLCQQHVDEVVTVDTDQTCAAIQEIFEETRSIVEPAGALAVAGMTRFVRERGIRGKQLVAMNCGANVNFDRLRHIAERAAVGKEREALVAVDIPEQQGSFLAFCKALGRRGVTEFNYRYNDRRTARLFVGIQLSHGNSEKLSLLADLSAQGFAVEDLSDNELAKLHVRHMVGGPGHSLPDERLFRFRFPERPGALLDFLNAVGSDWNISLFHYRNHGSDYGRVLAGIQVPADDDDEFRRHLDDLGYLYWDETDNPAYRLFLG